jgi:hypothetical protein
MDSGLDASHRPGMTVEVWARASPRNERRSGMAIDGMTAESLLKITLAASRWFASAASGRQLLHDPRLAG